MKKEVIILFLLILSLGLVSAVAENQAGRNDPLECNEENGGQSYCLNNMTERTCAAIKCVGCGYGWFDKLCVIGCQNNSCINDDWRYSGAVAYSSPDFDVNALILGGKKIKDDIKELREAKKELKGDIKAYLKERKEIRAEIKGKNITFEKGEKDEIKLRIKNFTAKTTLNITEEIDENNNTILVFQHGNKTREIKIMPDTASERALERLKIKVCNESNNCTIELKDVPAKKTSKLVYELRAEKKAKILGLFNKKLIVTSQVDAETGDTIVKTPWWSFLAKQE